MTDPNPLDAVLSQLAELRARLDATDIVVAGHEAKLADPQQRPYQPVPTVPWWQLDDRARAIPLARLRHWIDEVFRPSYGHLAARLPDCWADHDLCLFYLDWLSELWNSLYVPPKRPQRILAGQAEFSTRLLPAAVERIAAEAAGCGHARRRTG
jgi:hypothetical protein